MSHKATNWAVAQKGLPPGAKLVLWHLATRHNPELGCYPSQAQLAADAEISRSGLNNQLNLLEERGLIRRIRRADGELRTKLSTRYILGFEADFAHETSPDSGHGTGEKPCPKNLESPVQKLDMNPVRETVSTTTARMRRSAVVCCLAEAGPGLDETSRRIIRATDGIVGDWIDSGFDLDLDVLPAIRLRTFEPRGGPIRTWGYFTPVIARFHAQRIARLPPSPIAEKPGKQNPGGAPEGQTPDHVRMIADWIRSDRYLPPSAVTNSIRDALLARGLVTRAELRARQIY